MAKGIDENIIKVVLVVLVVGLILYMYGSFQTTELSLINSQGYEKVLAGSEQTYTINLRTVDPKQFETALHYREQFGRWRLETLNGTLISPGTQKQLTAGQYFQDITINIPFEYQQLVLVADIIEYQYSAAKPEGPWLKDEGTIRASEKLIIEVYSCVEHADCAVDTCLGQFGYCSEGLCEVKGECKDCIAATDCNAFEEAGEGIIYECVNYQCLAVEEPDVIDQVKETFSEPILEPGVVKEGEVPQPKDTPPLLGFAIIILIGVIIFMVSKMKTGRRRR